MKTIVKTAGSFDKVLASCKSIGGRYQPKPTALSITALSALADRSQQTAQAVIMTRAAYRKAVNDREGSFAGIPKLAVRIVRMLAVFESSRENIADANSLKNMLQIKGRPKKSGTEKTEETAAPARRAASRRHYDMRTETFADLISLIAGMNTYDPNEADLKLDALKETLADLKTKSHAVNVTAIAFDKARRERRELIYGANGMTERIKAVKDYLRGAFGSASMEFGLMTE